MVSLEVTTSLPSGPGSLQSLLERSKHPGVYMRLSDLGKLSFQSFTTRPLAAEDPRMMPGSPHPPPIQREKQTKRLQRQQDSSIFQGLGFHIRIQHPAHCFSKTTKLNSRPPQTLPPGMTPRQPRHSLPSGLLHKTRR